MQLPHCENGQNCAIPFLGWLRVREKITCALSLHVPWSQVYVNFWLQLYIPGGPIKTVQLIKSIFSGLCSNHHISFLILLDRATFSHYNDTKIIKFGWELLIWWVISDGLSFLGYAQFLEYRQHNYKILAHSENDSLEKNTHELKSFQPNVMILMSL